jgi:hypothetical protein
LTSIGLEETIPYIAHLSIDTLLKLDERRLILCDINKVGHKLKLIKNLKQLNILYSWCDNDILRNISNERSVDENN